MDLSIIIPARDAQGLIAACLRSVTRCPRGPIGMECLVVDDGSRDDTPAIVKRYIERDSRIRLVAGERSRSMDPRDRGIEEAKGRYLMFLSPQDLFCEDAWEQIGAAVTGEYADFVAFSRIVSDPGGKLKAEMLPISDVVSTDMQEARRLMYSGPALSSCRGKLLRTDIVKMGRITFRTDLVAGVDHLFILEYFGNCESCLLTKAMICCCRQKGESLAHGAGMEARLDALEVCCRASREAVERCGDPELAGRMQVHHLDMLIGLFREFGRECRHDKGALEAIYQKALGNSNVRRILADADGQAMHSVRRAHAYRLLKSGNAGKIRRSLWI